MNKVQENYAISNKLENLIPIVNPKLRGKSGIEAALLYRRDKSCKEVDSSELVREAYNIYYGTSIPSSSCINIIFFLFCLWSSGSGESCFLFHQCPIWTLIPAMLSKEKRN